MLHQKHAETRMRQAQKHSVDLLKQRLFPIGIIEDLDSFFGWISYSLLHLCCHSQLGSVLDLAFC
jgi:hypothetical protein